MTRIETRPETDDSPFHSGELEIQRRVGVADEIGPWAKRVIRPFLPEQHREFYGQLPFIVAAARDAEGRPWATLLAGDGKPGFATSPTPDSLRLDGGLVPGDALEGALDAGSALGLLGIELSTRRRNRVNGHVRYSDRAGLELEVGQAFGNCPQYIREREWETVPATERGRASLVSNRSTSRRSGALDEDARDLIESADTFFIASGFDGDDVESRDVLGMDASHRGGPVGFVRILPDGRLAFPDYSGNNHFNTLGNLVRDPRAGLTFVDFETGGLLQLTGRTEIIWEGEAVRAIRGASRLILFEIDDVVALPAALPIRWRAAGGASRPLRLVRKTRESDDVFSFEWAAADGLPLPGFVPGQHLPISVKVAGAPEPVRRTYSLSNAPGEGVYRISVKREAKGEVSRILHDTVEVGANLPAGTPAGEFQLLPNPAPIVLVSAGIGITPMASMLHDLSRRRDSREVNLFHVARDGRHAALVEELRRLTQDSAHRAVRLWQTSPDTEVALGIDSDPAGRDHEGRLRAEDVLSAIGRDQAVEAHFYLCGPIMFMSEIQTGLEAAGISADRIHSESFGPAAEGSVGENDSSADAG